MENSPSPFSTPIIVMGVSGCGKSLIGTKLASHFKSDFIDGDQLHPKKNIVKMHSGIPLDDSDRWPWLDKIAMTMLPSVKQKKEIIVACSALRQTYRQYLRDKLNTPIQFLHLQGSKQVISQRLDARKNHFMPKNLLESQFAALEAPGSDENVVTIDIDNSVDHILNLAIDALTSTNSGAA